MLTRSVLARRVGLALGLLAALAAGPAAADYDNGYGYLRTVEGSATLLQTGSQTRSPAEINQPVLAGDRLIVPARSRVEIVLADRNLLRIDGGSEIVLERLAGSPESSDRATVLRLLEGNLQLIVLQESLGEELPRIETPNATIFVQDYGTYRITTDQEIFTELVVREGRAEVVTDRRSEQVRADQQAFVEGDSRIDVEPAGSTDALERWARRLDEEGDVDSRYLDDNLRYAAAPLSRHGSWVEHEGTPYWRPRVDAGWRPYWQGRWAHTPAGMTWVSYEPWGWVTSHYGSWDYVPAFGWAWRPGRTWAPAWVYWYWGPSYTGWCPVGYYTRYYGSRWGRGTGFHSGVYGWAGGDWGHFNNWTFVPANYFRGYRKGYRDGYWDGYGDGRRDEWREHRNVRRYAVPIDRLRDGHGSLERGIVTTDTRPLTPDALDDPRRAVRVLTDHPSARRVGARGDRGTGELPDVTDFVARRPELPTGVRRVVVADENDARRLAGSPLRPDTLGEKGENGRRGARTLPRGGDENGRGADGSEGSVSSRPRIIVGDGDRPTTRPSAPGSDGATGATRSPRMGRPAQGEPGGAARPERPEGRGGVRALPRDPDGRDTEGAAGAERSPRMGTRPSPNAPGGAPRPESGVRTLPRRDQNEDNDGGSAGATRSPRMGTRPAPSDPGGAPRPDRGVRSLPRTEDRVSPRSGGAVRRGDSERPPTTYRPVEPREPEQYRPSEPRVHRPTEIDSPRRNGMDGGSSGYRRPEPRTSRPEASDNDRPSPRSTPSPRMSSPRTYERPAPPSSSRGGYERPSRPEPRVEPRTAPPSRSEPPSASPRSERRSAPADRGSSRGSSGSAQRRGERRSDDGGRGNN